MAIEERVVRGDAAATEQYDWGTITWLDSAALTGGALTVGRVRIEAGASNPRHRHPNCEEALYLLAGALAAERCETVLTPRGREGLLDRLTDDPPDHLVRDEQDPVTDSLDLLTEL